MANENDIRKLLQASLEENVFSGYQLLVARGSKRLNLFGGMTSHWPDAVPVQCTTWFDIGSLTKVVSTLSLFVPLFQSGRVALSTRVGEVLPTWTTTPYSDIQIGELFNHCSGLIDWLPFYLEKPASVEAFFQANTKRIITSPARQKAVYSDLNYWILGEILNNLGVTIASFPEKGQQWFGMKRTQFGPLPANRTAATEYCLWRKKICHGFAFDENCFSMGGVAPHAGLFSTADDLSGFCEEWLRGIAGRSQWISQPWAQELSSAKKWLPSSTWGIGWDTRSTQGSSAGERFSGKSFGHLGFPGASLWIDPQMQGYAIFLTNRIHPSRFDTRIRSIRPKLHDLVYEFWEQL